MPTKHVIFGGRKPIPRIIHKFRMWRNDFYKYFVKLTHKKDRNRYRGGIICRKCGKCNDLDSNFCTQCGAQLKNHSKKHIQKALAAGRFIERTCKAADRQCDNCIYEEIYDCCPFLGLPHGWNL